VCRWFLRTDTAQCLAEVATSHARSDVTVDNREYGDITLFCSKRLT
jgi:hypothetical protein